MIKTQTLINLVHRPARLEDEFAQKRLRVFCHIPAWLSRYLADNHANMAIYLTSCNIFAWLSKYLADNRANTAHYIKKLTRPVGVWLATSYVPIVKKQNDGWMATVRYKN